MYKYLLPSGIEINAERICDAVLRKTEYPQQHFDTETGNLVEIASRKDLGIWVQKIGKTRRYIYIEHFLYRGDASRDASRDRGDASRDTRGGMALFVAQALWYHESYENEPAASSLAQKRNSGSASARSSVCV